MRLFIFLVAALVMAAPVLADGGLKKVGHVRIKDATNELPISATNTQVVAGTAITSPAFSLVPSEFQSVSVTITATAAFSTGITLTFTACDGYEVTQPSPTYMAFDPVVTKAITDASGPYSRIFAISLPVCGAGKITWGADSGSPKIPYTVSRAVISRY